MGPHQPEIAAYGPGLGSRALVSRLTCMGHHLLEQLLSYLLLVFSDFLSIFATFIARRDFFFVCRVMILIYNVQGVY